MNYISLFSGIGGFEYGIQQSKYGDDLECIGYSEIDKYAENIYQKHYPDHTRLGDARQIQTKDIPDFDLLVGGFPCQAFSNCGKRRGFDDTRGTLFFEIARLLQDKRPRYFLLENVRGLLHHDQGKTFQTILGVLSDLGYNVTWKILNSKDYGVPQNRERIYIKGYSRERERCAEEVLSIRETKDTLNATTRRNKRTNTRKLNWKWGKTRSVKWINSNGNSLTLTAGGHNSGHNQILINKKLPIKNNSKKGYLLASCGDNITLDSSTGRGRVKKDYTGTLTTNCAQGIVTNDYNIRRLTPIECERLQGFPDNWTLEGYDGTMISDTQRYKCIGNAVTTNVITYIFDTWTLNS